MDVRMALFQGNGLRNRRTVEEWDHITVMNAPVLRRGVMATSCTAGEVVMNTLANEGPLCTHGRLGFE